MATAFLAATITVGLLFMIYVAVVSALCGPVR